MACLLRRLYTLELHRAIPGIEQPDMVRLS